MVDWKKPGSLSMMLLFALIMTKMWRYSVCFPFQIYEQSFQNTMQVFEAFQNYKKNEGVYMLTTL